MMKVKQLSECDLRQVIIDEHTTALQQVDADTGLTGKAIEDGYHSGQLPGFTLVGRRELHYPHGRDVYMFIVDGADPVADEFGSIPVKKLWMQKSGGEYFIRLDDDFMYAE